MKPFGWNCQCPPLPSATEVPKGEGTRLQKEVSYIEMFLNGVYFILKFLGCMYKYFICIKTCKLY